MSVDKTRQLINELESHGTFAIVVTWLPASADGAIRKGDQLRVQATSDMDNEATAQKLLAVAVELNKQLGLLPADFLKRYGTEG